MLWLLYRKVGMGFGSGAISITVPTLPTTGAGQ